MPIKDHQLKFFRSLVELSVGTIDLAETDSLVLSIEEGIAV